MSFRLIRHGMVDSTSERAFSALEAGEALNGDVHLARGQTAGRGRRGRSWHSAPDEGLYMSLILLPSPPAYKPSALTIATGLAVIEALNDLGLAPYSERAPRLKWPNDVLVGEAKVCGILTESRAFKAEHPHYVVGLGLNVRQLSFPAELQAERPVTSLAQLDLDVTVESASRAVLERLDGRLTQVRRDHRRLAEDFLAASGLLRRRVIVGCGNESQVGEIHSLSLAEGLELFSDERGAQQIPLEFIQSVEPC